jgi:hypothetical protein
MRRLKVAFKIPVEETIRQGTPSGRGRKEKSD